MELKREALVLIWKPALSLGVALYWHFNLETPKPSFKPHMLPSCRMKLWAEHFSSSWVSTQCVVSSKTISASERQKLEIARSWCFALTCKNWKVRGWQWYKKRTPMWSKDYFYLSVIACFKTSSSKKARLKLPLFFSEEHCPVNLHLKGSVTQIFPSLFAYVSSFWLCKAAPWLASHIPVMPELLHSHIHWGIPAVRHDGVWYLWGGRNLSLMVSAYFHENSYFFFLYLFPTLLF